MSALAWSLAIAAGLTLSASLWWFWLSFRAALGADLSAGDEGDAAMRSAASLRRRELEGERDALVRSLRDLELDYETGKLSESDFESLRESLRGRARQVLRALDEDLAPYRQRIEELLQAKGNDASSS